MTMNFYNEKKNHKNNEESFYPQPKKKSQKVK